MGWRKELKKRRKLARVKKKELYVTDSDYRASVDERKKKILQSAINIGGAVAKTITGGGIPAALNSLKAQNEQGVSTQVASRVERINIDNKLRGYSTATAQNENHGLDKKTLVYFGVAAIGLFLFTRK